MSFTCLVGRVKMQLTEFSHLFLALRFRSVVFIDALQGGFQVHDAHASAAVLIERVDDILEVVEAFIVLISLFLAAEAKHRKTKLASRIY